MLDELKFVQSAVSRKALIPGMMHFAIEQGTIRSYNGNLALSSSIDFDIDCKPKADQLIDAISLCSKDFPTTITMTEFGKLRIQNGPFRVLVDCLDEPTPHVLPEGDIINFSGVELRKALVSLLPFVGDDASRMWTNGILLDGKSAFATNNVIVVEYWLGTPFPFTINLPSTAAKEIIRIEEDPIYAQITPDSITFHYGNNKWIRTGLYDKKWPEVTKILDIEGDPKPIHPDFFNGLQIIKPFLDKIGNVYFEKNNLCSHYEDVVGAKYALHEFPYKGVYALEMLELLQGIAYTIDWSLYPKPCPFFGNMLRGAIIGRHDPREDRS